MQSFFKYLFMVVLVCGFTFGAKATGMKNIYAAETGGERIISTSGRGIVKIKPDTASINIGVVTTDAQSSVAQQKNNEIYANVINALNNLNIPKENIKTENFYISQQYNYNDKTGEKTPSGYEVRNFVSITTKDIDNVGKYIDATVSAGATDISRVNFYVEDPNAYYNSALKLAIENAKSSASIISGAIEAGNISVKNVREERNYNSYSVMAEGKVMADQARGAGGSSINYDDIQVEANVTIDFVLE